MIRNILYFLGISFFLVCCKSNKEGKVIAGSEACWSDTLKFQGEEKLLLKTYFELIKAFETKDTVKLLSLLSDSVHCGECEIQENIEKDNEDNKMYDKLSFLRDNWNHYLYWSDSYAGAQLNINKETNEFGRVSVGNDCSGEECSSTLLIYEKVKNRILLKKYITMP